MASEGVGQALERGKMTAVEMGMREHLDERLSVRPVKREDRRKMAEEAGKRSRDVQPV